MSNDNNNNTWTNIDVSELHENYNEQYDFTSENTELINVFKKVYKGILNEESPRAQQPEGFRNVILKEHQLTAIYAMNELENRPDRCFHNYNVGVIADPVGSGKSYSILGHIMKKPELTSMWGNYTTERHHSSFSGFEYEAEREIKSNLLVVSHSIYNQWIDYLNHTNLKYLKIARRTDFGATNLELEEKIRSGGYQIVILKANLWNDFQLFLLNDALQDRRNYYKVQRNSILVETMNQVPVSPDAYRGYVRSMLRLIRENVTSWRVDSLLTTRISSIAQEQQVIDGKMNDLLAIIENVKSAPQKYELGSITRKLGEFGDKFITESVGFRKVPFIWERIIVDEIDTVKISNCQPMCAKFYWLLTNNMENLMFPNRMNFQIERIVASLIRADPENRSFLPQEASGFHTIGFFRKMWEECHFSKFYPQLQHIFIRNERSFVENSFLHELVGPIFMRYWSHAPHEMRIVGDIFQDQHQEIISNLQAGNWSGALRIFADSSTITATRDDFLTKIRDQFLHKVHLIRAKLVQHNESLRNKQSKLDYANNQLARYREQIETTDRLRYPDVYDEIQQIIENTQNRIFFHEERVLTEQNRIHEMNEMIENYERRVLELENRVRSDLTNSHCSICFEHYNQPIACTPCCQNMFCLECITTWIERNGRCAMCRADLQINQCSILEERLKRETGETEESNHDECEDEEDAALMPIITERNQNHNRVMEQTYESDKTVVICRLIDRLLEEPESKILIYSEHDESFRGKVLSWMVENEIEYELLSGSSGSIESRLKRFKEGKTRILLLNARHFGCGLNLQMATDLIFYHRMNEPLERQILGRAQRFGRKDALRVHSFLYRDIEEISPILR